MVQQKLDILHQKYATSFSLFFDIDLDYDVTKTVTTALFSSKVATLFPPISSLGILPDYIHTGVKYSNT